jgi:16S rRNA processing protein RimM
MNRTKYFSIGKFAGTHGLKGELVLKHALGKKTDLKGLKTIFLKEASENYFPWFVEACQIKNDTETYVKLEGLNTKEAAQKLAVKDVWLMEKDFTKYSDKNASISLLGFTIIEGNKELGVIEEVMEQPHQILCRLTIQGKEVYIPLHEESLLEINRRKKTILVALPNGLLEVYLT